MGALELRTRPFYFTLDSWPARGADLNQRKPVEFAAAEAERARGNTLGAIARIAGEGNRLGRLEQGSNPIPELAAQYWTRQEVTTDDLSLRFLTPPALTWVGGGVEASYRPTIDLLL